MKYESEMSFKAKIESINLEADADYSRITLNHLKFANPVLDDIFFMINSGEVAEIEIKRLVQHDPR